MLIFCLNMDINMLNMLIFKIEIYIILIFVLFKYGYKH